MTTASTEVTPLQLGDRIFDSRLLLGTGKYVDADTMKAAFAASGTEIITVALRRVNLSKMGSGGEEDLIGAIDQSRYLLLPNTAGCYTAEDAVRYARLGRAAGLNDWVKLEVIGDERTLLPDVIATIGAAKIRSGSR